MSNLHNLQHNFMGYLLADNPAIVDAIVPCAQVPADVRLNIYATGYRLRLKEAIETDFERLAFYLGDDLFDQLVDAYIDRYPSKYPNLRVFSQFMVELICETEPFKQAPELLELARIEQAFTASFDAADTPTVGVEQLAQIAPDRWPEMCFSFHSSVQPLMQVRNSFTLWQALSQQQEPPAVALDPACWLVWRRDLISEYRCLSDAETTLLNMALAGKPFSALCETLLTYYPEQETSLKAVEFLQGWLQDQLVIRIDV